MRRSVPQGDLAATDTVGTILMVAVVVAIGAVLSLMATAALTTPEPVDASFVLRPVSPGDEAIRVLHAQGEPLDLSSLRLVLARGASSGAVPPDLWTTPDSERLSPGDELALPLDPPAVAGERLTVSIVSTGSNEVLATLSTRAGAAPAGLPPATLHATLAPSDVTADGIATTLLTVRVSHPQGALAVASVVADLSNATLASGSGPVLVPLTDSGSAGDAVGGDGVWSGLLTFPRATPLGPYVLRINATDASGSLNANATLPFRVAVNGLKTECIGCAIDNGDSSSEGTRLLMPTSENATKLRLVNWTVDKLYPQRLDEDYVLFRITGGTQSWSVFLQLEEHNGQPYATFMRMWTSSAESTYTPRNSTGNAPRLPLTNLSMDMLHPVESLQWVQASGSPAAHPAATYQKAGVSGSPAFIITYMGQDETTGNQQKSINTGIFSFDVVVEQ